MPVDPAEPGKEQDAAGSWGLAAGAGTELVAAVLAGLLGGQWLDGKFGTGPWLMLAGAIAGITVGLYRLIRIAAQRRDGRKKRG